jgi:hypothetical protein
VKRNEGPVKNGVLYLWIDNIRNYVLFFLPIVLLFLLHFCFNLYCGGFVLFCNVCVYVCFVMCLCCACVRVCVGFVMCVFVRVL